MERNYNVSGADRKALVKVIGEALGVKPKYMGTPSYAFRIGGYEVSQHGVLTFEEDGETASVLAAIEAAGFIAKQDTPEATQSHRRAKLPRTHSTYPKRLKRLKSSHRRRSRHPRNSIRKSLLHKNRWRTPYVRCECGSAAGFRA